MKEILIISRLITKLNNMKFYKVSGDMINLLNDLLDEDEKPCDIAISGNGLRNGPEENMQQGFSIEPFYFR